MVAPSLNRVVCKRGINPALGDLLRRAALGFKVRNNHVDEDHSISRFQLSAAEHRSGLSLDHRTIPWPSSLRASILLSMPLSDAKFCIVAAAATSFAARVFGHFGSVGGRRRDTRFADSCTPQEPCAAG